MCVDGRLHKISDEVVFSYDRADFTAPWTLRSERVALSFRPWRLERLWVPLGLASANLHLCFGHFQGRVATDDGAWIEVADLLGWAEEMRARW